MEPTSSVTDSSQTGVVAEPTKRRRPAHMYVALFGLGCMSLQTLVNTIGLGILENIRWPVVLTTGLTLVTMVTAAVWAALYWRASQSKIARVIAALVILNVVANVVFFSILYINLYTNTNLPN